MLLDGVPKTIWYGSIVGGFDGLIQIQLKFTPQPLLLGWEVAVELLRSASQKHSSQTVRQQSNRFRNFLLPTLLGHLARNMIQLTQILWLDRHEQESLEDLAQVIYESMMKGIKSGLAVLLPSHPCLAWHFGLGTSTDAWCLRYWLLALSLHPPVFKWCGYQEGEGSWFWKTNHIKWWTKIMLFFWRIQLLSQFFLDKLPPATAANTQTDITHTISRSWNIETEYKSKSLQGNMQTGMPLSFCLSLLRRLERIWWDATIQHAQRLQEHHPQSLENTFDMLRHDLPMHGNVPVKFGLVLVYFVYVNM